MADRAAGARAHDAELGVKLDYDGASRLASAGSPRWQIVAPAPMFTNPGCPPSRLGPGRDGMQLLARYLHMAEWLAVLYVGYAAQRGWCACGIPYDCQQLDFLTLFDDLSDLSLMGCALAWFTSATKRRRFAWLFSWQRWYLWAVYVGLPPLYSATLSIPFLRHSLTDIGTWGPGMAVMMAGVAALALAAIGLHLWLAKHGRSWAHLAAYALARVLVYLVVLVWALVLLGTSSAKVHVHHAYLGWGLAIWAEFNHWASGVVLAAGAAVLVQGVGAYSLDPIFSARMTIWKCIVEIQES